MARAKRRNPAMSASIFDFVRDLLLLRYRENADEEERAAQRQPRRQVPAAHRADHGQGDRGHGLLPLQPAGLAERSRRRAGPLRQRRGRVSRAERAAALPRLAHSLSSTSTHDTKRSEDVRARINVLSEVPREWRQHVLRWARWNRRFRTRRGRPAGPVGQRRVPALPDARRHLARRNPQRRRPASSCVERLQQYMLKVAREAKSHTSWISPHEAYEQALLRFVADIFQADKKRPFLADLHQFAQQVADHGRWNSLSQVVLKVASPGVPDFYQGTELWTLTLVDPDNRQPVDFAAAAAAAGGAAEPRTSAGPRVAAAVASCSSIAADGRIKLFATWQALQARRQLPELFTAGEYLPLEVRGKHAERIVALARRRGSELAIAVVPRLTVKLCGFGGPPPLGELWGDTAIVLPAGNARRRRVWSIASPAGNTHWRRNR